MAVPQQAVMPTGSAGPRPDTVEHGLRSWYLDDRGRVETNLSPRARLSTSFSRSGLGQRWSASARLSGVHTAMAEQLNNRIRQAREARGWTQAELAARIGVSRKTVNTVENQVFTPSTLIALKLARALELPVEDLFSIISD